jgi:hypothetical protein
MMAAVAMRDGKIVGKVWKYEAESRGVGALNLARMTLNPLLVACLDYPGTPGAFLTPLAR